MNICTSTITLSIIYTGYKRVERWWNFKNVISPFYRLYYIKEGSGRITIDKIPYELNAGTLFLIPKHSAHCYECDDYNTQFYIHFFDDFAGSRGIPSPSQLRLMIEATPLDVELVHRFYELNPNRALPTVDPRHYDNRRDLYMQHGCESDFRTAIDIESEGILMQLFSRFITPGSMAGDNGPGDKVNIATQYIHANIGRRITIDELSDVVCVSKSYLTRMFRRVAGMSPNEYIQHKRVERAQHLLHATSFDIIRIAEMTGILNPAQFTKLFVKIAGCTPSDYRRNQRNV